MGFYWAVRAHGQFKLGCILLLIIMLKCAFGFHCFQMLGKGKKEKKNLASEFSDVLPTFWWKKSRVSDLMAVKTQCRV